jgi:ribulose-phosphate 3-epimerase
MMKPADDWVDALPSDRLLAEFSLWSADLGRLVSEIARVEPFADIYHIDVADGHFSPSLLFFPDLVATIRKQTSKPLHVHLMAQDDILRVQVEHFAEAGADLISIHAENGDVDGALARIEDLGLEAGLVLQLHTPVAAALPYLDRVRILTLLGTRIGVKGQRLDDTATPRLLEARALLATRKNARRIVLAADGGIRGRTVPELRRAGAEMIVMGSLAFNAENLAERMIWVRAQPPEA